MQNKINQNDQGHWVLANVGKKVLRPGGKELSIKLIDAMQIQPTDSVVEFAPGIGLTAALILEKKPASYFGIELNKNATLKLAQKFSYINTQFIHQSATHTKLPTSSINKVIGEAMLTMQADHRKSEIIREAFRILKPGGYYAIHELGLEPSNISAEIKKEILQNLARIIKVNARPLTQDEWCNLLKKEGFTIKCIFTNPMLLMSANRIIKDEGFLGTLKIIFTVLTQKGAKQKVLAIRNVFKQNKKHLTAFGIIAEK